MDLTQRAITYIPPHAPWKISDHASAGSQRLRLSGLNSRAHLIRNYTYPASATERALAHLAHLYAQKGHDLAQCLRVISANDASPCLIFGHAADFVSELYCMISVPLPPINRVRVCVCVCADVCVCVNTHTKGPTLCNSIIYLAFPCAEQGASAWHDITTLANEASDVMGSGQRRLTVYLPF